MYMIGRRKPINYLPVYPVRNNCPSLASQGQRLWFHGKCQNVKQKPCFISQQMKDCDQWFCSPLTTERSLLTNVFLVVVQTIV